MPPFIHPSRRKPHRSRRNANGSESQNQGNGGDQNDEWRSTNPFLEELATPYESIERPPDYQFMEGLSRLSTLGDLSERETSAALRGMGDLPEYYEGGRYRSGQPSNHSSQPRSHSSQPRQTTTHNNPVVAAIAQPERPAMPPLTTQPALPLNPYLQHPGIHQTVPFQRTFFPTVDSHDPMHTGLSGPASRSYNVPTGRHAFSQRVRADQQGGYTYPVGLPCLQCSQAQETCDGAQPCCGQCAGRQRQCTFKANM